MERPCPSEMSCSEREVSAPALALRYGKCARGTESESSFSRGSAAPPPKALATCKTRALGLDTPHPIWGSCAPDLRCKTRALGLDTPHPIWGSAPDLRRNGASISVSALRHGLIRFLISLLSRRPRSSSWYLVRSFFVYYCSVRVIQLYSTAICVAVCVPSCTSLMFRLQRIHDTPAEARSCAAPDSRASSAARPIRRWPRTLPHWRARPAHAKGRAPRSCRRRDTSALARPCPVAESAGAAAVGGECAPSARRAPRVPTRAWQRRLAAHRPLRVSGKSCGTLTRAPRMQLGQRARPHG